MSLSTFFRKVIFRLETFECIRALLTSLLKEKIIYCLFSTYYFMRRGKNRIGLLQFIGIRENSFCEEKKWQQKKMPSLARNR